ncbi:MAG: hypothetical protein AUK63_153 [bacterium P3]|nr:MAG: hypothetical protein AUK63_153 [bacterium P3]KWW42386.1 MAG: hypothetical protein F083_290 [bacterium F083]
MNINRRTFNQYIADSDFRTLFIREMMWNNPQGQTTFDIIVDESTYRFEQIAQRSGFQILTCQVREIPTSSLAKKIDTRLRRQANDYICIYFLQNSQHHLWVAPVNKVEKRDLVLVEYDNAEAASFLYEKMDGLSFDLDDHTTIMDVKERVQGTFIVNSEKITKDFYTGFRKEHTRFVNFISGMDDDIEPKKNQNKQWYTSVMLNRLMFCYFIQKKGFLDMNENYLREKLSWVKREKGEDRFYDSFYKGFLRSLFHNGLNSPRHERDFQQKYGRIPYLNGGMFDEHELEKQYPNIDIADEAFESLFTFFDNWRWHLDDRLTATGRDINPDVLGYIFEQYINDRAQMGAYYTKEDITEYIGRNTIVPFLLDATKKTTENAFKPNGSVWKYLQESGDRYIYDAVKHGHEEPIPDYIAEGIDTTRPNLLVRRSRWNERTPEPWALPTEIWRETVERLQRYESIKAKILNGEIIEVNDFITCNLNIRQFVYDYLQDTDDHLFVKHFYAALQHVSILDPTCGSGAFLFAALNILEPLYEICITRMQEWNAANPKLFENELHELNVKYRSNIRYFIYKSIILRNLYGVDIMVEATEIAKLRLFLKMVAVVDVNPRDPNLGLDPLPDIDFNIRCGNTLVGYATEKELELGVKYMDMFARQEFESKVYDEIDIVSTAYDTFRKVQLEQNADLETFKNAKAQLKERLAKLNELLNQNLHAATNAGMDYDKWKKSHQPFHWLAEFYEIIYGNGGFDVIIGNPPYVEHSNNNVTYSLAHLESKTCGNLYGNCIERGLQIGNEKGKFSFIIPVAITCSKRMDTVIKLLKEKANFLLFANFDDRPGKLFEMIEHLRATIFIASRMNGNVTPRIFGTKYNRWYSEHRNLLFQQLRFVDVAHFVDNFTIPKFSDKLECSINDKILKNKFAIAYTYGFAPKDNNVYYRAAGGGYFLLMKIQKSITYIDGVLEDVKAEKSISISSEYNNACVGSILSSSLFYWNYIGYTDCRNLTKSFIDTFPIPKSAASDVVLSNVGKKLFANYEDTKYTKNTTYKTTGRNVVYDEYYPKLSKKYIDEIDKVLAKHYGFTEEELDFIINYDIKYRMGDELDNNE